LFFRFEKRGDISDKSDDEKSGKGQSFQESYAGFDEVKIFPAHLNLKDFAIAM